MQNINLKHITHTNIKGLDKWIKTLNAETNFPIIIQV